jgi:hypothetical protein
MDPPCRLAWELIIPPGTTITGVSAEVVAGGAGLVGNGNGTVKVTVQENTTGLWFYSTLEIAGIKHKITQDYKVNR